MNKKYSLLALAAVAVFSMVQNAEASDYDDFCSQIAPIIASCPPAYSGNSYQGYRNGHHQHHGGHHRHHHLPAPRRPR